MTTKLITIKSDKWHRKKISKVKPIFENKSFHYFNTQVSLFNNLTNSMFTE